MGQNKISNVQNHLREANNNVDAFRHALERNDTNAAREHQRELMHNLDQVAVEIGAPAGQLSNIQKALDTHYNQETKTVLDNLSEAQKNSGALRAYPNNPLMPI